MSFFRHRERQGIRIETIGPILCGILGLATYS